MEGKGRGRGSHEGKEVIFKATGGGLGAGRWHPSELYLPLSHQLSSLLDCFLKIKFLWRLGKVAADLHRFFFWGGRVDPIIRKLGRKKMEYCNATQTRSASADTAEVSPPADHDYRHIASRREHPRIHICTCVHTHTHIQRE